MVSLDLSFSARLLCSKQNRAIWFTSVVALSELTVSEDFAIAIQARSMSSLRVTNSWMYCP